MALYQRGEKVYSATSLLLPYELKQEAKKLNINLTRTLVQALEAEVKRLSQVLP
ncbi:MAG: type II toxin-antitoxin system CcdA family antitoxin [Methanoregula sp.]|jgi:post-segregation antitoxin (ccd killing protein)|nr:type II toxin-antitoxin system CcdA family antitoxin [Methanoregula sp.]